MKEKKEKQKKNKIFLLLMILYISIWLVAIVIVADMAWDKAYIYQSNYDNAKKESIPERFMDDLVGDVDARTLSKWLSQDGEYKLSLYSNLDEYEMYFEQLISGHDMTYRLTDEKNIYELLAGDNVIARVKIASDNIYNEYNFTGWRLVDADVLSYMRDTFSKTIVVDKSYSVYINERELTSDYRISENVTPMQKYMSTAMRQEYGYDTYEVDGFLVEPDIYVVDKNGDRVENSSSDSDRVEYLRPATKDFDLNKRSFVINTFYVYFEHMNKLKTLEDIEPYFLKGTNAYSLIEAAQKSLEWVVPVKKITIEKYTIDNYEEYASNFFSCDVYMSVIKDYGYTTKNENFNAEVLFKKVNNKWYLDTFILK